MPDVVYRKFDFDAYPQHIRNLHNYAWKTLIIQKLLSEFDGTVCGLIHLSSSQEIKQMF